LSLGGLLRNKPVIYEIVPPRRDRSRYNTELRGVEEVLNDTRIAAINIPELINRGALGAPNAYSLATIPPEDYAMMIRERKEGIVNIIAPRLKREEFLRRTHKILHDYKIRNIVVVGKERHEDVLPGPGVLEALSLLEAKRDGETVLGGICIFNRASPPFEDYPANSPNLDEARRVWLKSRAGCDFVTSQIVFDPKPAIEFFSSYQELCVKTETTPLTTFVSLTTVPSPRILALLQSLDVVIPIRVMKRLSGSNNMARESLAVSTEVLNDILDGLDSRGVRSPLGLQIEQIGVDNDVLSLELMDKAYPLFRAR